MHNELNTKVVEKLVGKKVVDVVSKGRDLTLKFDDGCELAIQEVLMQGADGGWYQSTSFSLKSPVCDCPKVLFYT